MCSKIEAQRIHAKSRCSERYGIDLTDEQYNRLRNYVKLGRRSYPDGTVVNFLERQSCRVTKLQIITQDETFIVIYDKLRASIITFLLPEEEYKASLRVA